MGPIGFGWLERRHGHRVPINGNYTDRSPAKKQQGRTLFRWPVFYAYVDSVCAVYHNWFSFLALDDRRVYLDGKVIVRVMIPSAQNADELREGSVFVSGMFIPNSSK